MLDRLTSMAVFVKAADLGSFTAAGKALGLTSQMVGKHIGALEARLGSPLLRRTTRKQSLTEVGRLYYERCRLVLAEAASADELVEGMTASPRGRLRVSAPVGFGASRLAPALSDFLTRYPDVTVELNLTDRFVDLIDEGYDAVLRLGPIGDGGLVARELVRHEQVACAAPAYLQAHGTPKTPADLAEHACLGFVNWSGLPYADWRFGMNGQIHAVEVRSRFQVNDGRVLLAAAIAGHGVILQPEAVVADAIQAGALLPILVDYAAPGRSMYLMFAPHRPHPPKLRALIDHLLASFPLVAPQL